MLSHKEDYICQSKEVKFNMKALLA